MFAMDKDVDEYIAAFDEPLRTRLSEMRMIIRHAVPEASEVFSNAMPGYVLHDSLVWFAGVRILLDSCVNSRCDVSQLRRPARHGCRQINHTRHPCVRR
jgi:hypothetical protein